LRPATLAGLAVLALAVDVSAESRPRYGGRLEASLLSEPATLDPHDATTHAELTLAEMIFDGLYRLDDTPALIPELATALPQVSEDGLEITIPIRVGARFHDGHKLTAADVVASLKRLRTSRVNGWLVAAMVDVKAEGDAVVLALKYPSPELGVNLAAPAAAITRAGRQPRRGRMHGTGPFIMRRVGGGALRLRAFDGHHRGRAYLDRVRLRWFSKPDEEARDYEVGRSHVSFRGAVAYPGHRPKYRTHSIEGPATVLAYVGLGRAHARILGDRNFRLALSAAINRTSMRNLGSGERVVATVSPEAIALGGPRASAAVLRARLDRAKRFLDAASASVDALRPGKRPTLEILVDRSRVDDRDIADKVLASLFRLDVPARVVELSAQAFARRVATGGCDLYIGQLSPQVATTSGELIAAFGAGGDNWARSRLALAPLDLGEARVEFGKRLPIIPLFHRTIRVHHRADVYGVRFEGSGQLVWSDVFLFGSARRN
jgi:hypothetical protein